MKQRIKITALLALLLLTAPFVQAQGFDVPSGEELIQQGEDYLNDLGGGGNGDDFVGPPAPSDSLIPEESTLYGDGGTLVRKGFSQFDSQDSSLTRSRGSGEMFFGQSSRRNQDGGTNKSFEINPGQRTLTSIAPMNPMRTARGAMNTMSLTNEIGVGGLNSPLSVFYTTTMLTDPALAQAGMSAASLGLSYSGLIGQSEANLFNQAAASPDAGEVVTNSFLGCITTAMEAGLTRSQASEKCLGAGGAEEGNGSVDSVGFTMGDDPSFRVTQGSTLPAGSAILLSDYIFKHARENLSGVSAYADKAETLRKLEESFKSILGDYTFTLMKRSFDQNGNEVNANQNFQQAVHAGTRRIVATRVPAQIGPDETRRQLIKDRYNDQMTLLQLLCTYSIAGLHDDQSAGRPSFWDATTEPAQRLRNLSVRGYDYPRELIDELYARYMLTPGFLCTSLSPADGGQSNLVALMAATSSSQVREYHRVIYGLAERIAEAQFLGTLLGAEDLVHNLASSGARSSMMRQYAYALIHGAAGTNDIDRYYMDNLDKTRTLAGNVLVRLAGERSGGADIAGGMRRSTGNSAPNGFKGNI